MQLTPQSWETAQAETACEQQLNGDATGRFVSLRSQPYHDGLHGPGPTTTPGVAAASVVYLCMHVLAPSCLTCGAAKPPCCHATLQTNSICPEPCKAVNKRVSAGQKLV